MTATDKIGTLPEDKYNGGYKELSLSEINQKINEITIAWKNFLQENLALLQVKH